MVQPLYFTISELCNSDTAKKHNINNAPRTMTHINNMVNLIHYVLQPLREKLGKPIIVTSGFRCKELNEKVGGVANSQHTTGEAADIYVNGCKAGMLLNYIRTSGIEFDQLINEHNQWVHISYSHKHNRKQILVIK